MASRVDDTKENKKVAVAVRIRPRLEQRNERYEVGVVSKVDQNQVSCVNPRTAREQFTFAFDHVFDDADTQEEIYETAAADLAMSALDGVSEGRRVGNVILTYGQTGSGKTYTLLGKGLGPSDELLPESGIFLRVLSDLLRHKRRVKGQHLVIRLSIIEVYNSQLRDLLNDKQTLNWTEKGEDIVPKNPVHWLIDDIGRVKAAFHLARSNRAVASTLLNDESSRSHALFLVDLFQQVKCRDTPIEHLEGMVRSGQWEQTISTGTGIPFSTSRYHSHAGSMRAARMSSQAQHAYGVQTPRGAAPGAGSRVRSSSLTQRCDTYRSQSVPPYEMGADDGTLSPVAQAQRQVQMQRVREIQQQYPITHSNLTMVDLAGSERTKKSDAQGAVLKEAVAVNNSLSVLGKVIDNIVHHQPHIPFRETMLTRLLRSSFTSDRSKILLIANVAPTDSSFYETRDTCKFADRLQSMKPADGWHSGLYGTRADSEREMEYRHSQRQFEELNSEILVAVEHSGYVRQFRQGYRPVAPRIRGGLGDIQHKYRSTVQAREEGERRSKDAQFGVLLQQFKERESREREARDPQIARDRERAKQLAEQLAAEGGKRSKVEWELGRAERKVDNEQERAQAPHARFVHETASRQQLHAQLSERSRELARIEQEIERVKGELRDPTMGLDAQISTLRRQSEHEELERVQDLARDRRLVQRALERAQQRGRWAQLRSATGGLRREVSRLHKDQLSAQRIAGCARELLESPRVPAAPPEVSPLARHFDPSLRAAVYVPPSEPYPPHSDSESDSPRAPGRPAAAPPPSVGASAGGAGRFSLPPPPAAAAAALVPPLPLATATAAAANRQPARGAEAAKRPQRRRRSRDDRPRGTMRDWLDKRHAGIKTRLGGVLDRCMAAEEATDADGLEVFGLLNDVKLSEQHLTRVCDYGAAPPHGSGRQRLDRGRLVGLLPHEAYNYLLRALALFPQCDIFADRLAPERQPPEPYEFMDLLCQAWNRELQSRRS